MGEKVGLINSDGTPSALYKKFRNPTTSKSSLGEALRKGYTDIFAKDENADKLDKAKIKGLFMTRIELKKWLYRGETQYPKST